MTTTPFEYWRQDSGEERQLRIFISHRYGNDQALYDEVLSALYRNGFAVQDISLSATQVLSGPRGGKLPALEVQAEIAARIYTSDVVIAPSRPAVTRSHWVTWEVQLAAIGYGIPILFVNERNQQRSTRLVSEVAALGLNYRACNPVVSEIARNVADLVGDTRPNWTFRQSESDGAVRFRGPTIPAMDDVLRKHPFRARLAPVDLPTPQRRGLWGLFDRP